ncbi:uncharacterized protein BYT42DRAFT_616766 [Radiomyces spectabilis]|uniref:uncharacterized protein n=1 Tax=Radiomyces spectabilis TaxID=64574 RepID=UPI00221F32F8|nr:uncharacterized protein BYT42DRAFT_616766 [Radiomyces spectabilis]KAI8371695.1 hypothetical protein BYT42DRAFT_616766 [Radiomyces spectabilis]
MPTHLHSSAYHHYPHHPTTISPKDADIDKAIYQLLSVYLTDHHSRADVYKLKNKSRPPTSYRPQLHSADTQTSKKPKGKKYSSSGAHRHWLGEETHPTKRSPRTAVKQHTNTLYHNTSVNSLIAPLPTDDAAATVKWRDANEKTVSFANIITVITHLNEVRRENWKDQGQ